MISNTQAILAHAEMQPDRAALIIDQQFISWRALAHEIETRALQIQAAHPQHTAATELTVDPSMPVVDQALNALAKLHLGWPIVGATSGSTGTAKAYRRSQASWLHSFQADDQAFGINKTDVVMAPGNLSHSLFFYAMCRGLYAGATVILSNRFRPDRVWEQIARHRATVLYAVPTQLRLLLGVRNNMGGLDSFDGLSDHEDHDDSSDSGDGGDSFAAPSVRWVLSSGAKWFSDMTSALAACFPNACIAEFYGASELSFVSLQQHQEPNQGQNQSRHQHQHQHQHQQQLPKPALPTADAKSANAVGMPFPGVSIAILNVAAPKGNQPKHMPSYQTCATGQVGTIFVNTAGAFDQYLGPPPEDFHEFIAEDRRRWLSVGDQGYLDTHGRLFIVGRQSRKIIVSGKNLYPEEIEQLLQAHHAIDHAVVLGQPDPVRGERLLAILQLNQEFKLQHSPQHKPQHNSQHNPQPGVEFKTSGSITRGELIEFLRPHLEDFKIPRHFFTLADWPLTASSKTDYAALQLAVDQGLCQPISH
jgi:long-chain acyl-CoA synthetase